MGKNKKNKKKANVIPKTNTADNLSEDLKICNFCFLHGSFSTDKSVKLYLYKEVADVQYYICSMCLADITETRKRCETQLEDPKKDMFKDFLPWLLDDKKVALVQ